MTQLAQNVDLFGDPVPASFGRRGRPEHVATQVNRDKVTMLLALGWSQARIAAGLSIDGKTLRKNYRRELRFREEQRDRLDAALAMMLWAQARDGNVAAMREFRSFMERNDLMLYGQVDQPKPAKLGKKEAQLLAAQQPDTDTPLGELMARRDGRRERPN